MTSQAAADLAAEARVHLGRFLVGWDWVSEAREPGTTGPPVSRPQDIRQAVRAAQVWREDRDAVVASARDGHKIIGTVPSPVRLGVSAARFQIVDDLVDLTERMWNAANATALTLVIRESRTYTRACTWCVGGTLPPPVGWAWEWPIDPIACPRCLGGGRIPTGEQCPACKALGPCRCDRAAIAVALATGTIDTLLGLPGQLPAVHYVGVSDAEYTLADLADRAETAAGAGLDRRRLPLAECPVCGARELVPEVSHHDQRKWAITCYGPDCRCHGPGCPCGIGTDRRKDRRHVWPAATWDGPGGLAAALGVDLPGTAHDTQARQQIAQARADRRRAAQLQQQPRPRPRKKGK